MAKPTHSTPKVKFIECSNPREFTHFGAAADFHFSNTAKPPCHIPKVKFIECSNPREFTRIRPLTPFLRRRYRWIVAPGPLRKTGLQSTNPRVFTGKGSMNLENLNKTQPGASDTTHFQEIESRITEMMYI